MRADDPRWKKTADHGAIGADLKRELSRLFEKAHKKLAMQLQPQVAELLMKLVAAGEITFNPGSDPTKAAAQVVEAAFGRYVNPDSVERAINRLPIVVSQVTREGLEDAFQDALKDAIKQTGLGVSGIKMIAVGGNVVKARVSTPQFPDNYGDVAQEFLAIIQRKLGTWAQLSGINRRPRVEYDIDPNFGGIREGGFWFWAEF